MLFHLLGHTHMRVCVCTHTINLGDMVVLVEYLISPVSAHTASTVLFAFMAYLISSASTYRDTHTNTHTSRDVLEAYGSISSTTVMPKHTYIVQKLWRSLRYTSKEQNKKCFRGVWV